jgi:hypothetical protein
MQNVATNCKRLIWLAYAEMLTKSFYEIVCVTVLGLSLLPPLESSQNSALNSP